VDLGGFHGLWEWRACNLRHPVARESCPLRKIAGSNPAGLKAWRLGCLDAWRLGGWTLGSWSLGGWLAGRWDVLVGWKGALTRSTLREVG